MYIPMKNAVIVLHVYIVVEDVLLMLIIPPEILRESTNWDVSFIERESSVPL